MRISLLVLFIICALITQPLMAQHQVLYGMTPKGGSYGWGTIFKFDLADSTETVEWSFGSPGDGSYPQGDLIYYPANGLFYGLTAGFYSDSGYGAIFTFDPATNTENVVDSFIGLVDGGLPYGDLAFDPADGLFYGMTSMGGNYGYGTIFSFNPSTNIKQTVWNFGHFDDGQSPQGSLTYDAHTGLFYGMTIYGGSCGYGTLFSFDPVRNSATVIRSFCNPGDPAYPSGNLVFDPIDSSYFGLTSEGGYGFSDIVGYNTWSNICEYYTPGSNVVLPYGNFLFRPQDSLLYALASQGGMYSSGVGTIFTFNPLTFADNVVWSFGNGNDGEYPYGSLISDSVNGLFYGMTKFGGSGDSGTIFSFDPSTGIENVIWNFNHSPDGIYPIGSLLLYTTQSSTCPAISMTATQISDTSAYATATGGSAPYTYVWSTFPSQYGDSVTGLRGGEHYTVIVTDHNGCSGSAVVNIPCSAITITVTQIGDTAAIASASGGVPPYVITWETVPGQLSDTARGLTAGNSYTVRAYDQNGCSGVTTITTGIIPLMRSSIDIHPNPTTGMVSITGLTSGQTIEVYDYLGQRVSTITADNTTAQIDLASHESGVYMVTVLNSDGSVVSEKKVVKEN